MSDNGAFVHLPAGRMTIFPTHHCFDDALERSVVFQPRCSGAGG